MPVGSISCPGRNLRVAGFGVDSVWMNMRFPLVSLVKYLSLEAKVNGDGTLSQCFRNMNRSADRSVPLLFVVLSNR